MYQHKHTEERFTGPKQDTGECYQCTVLREERLIQKLRETVSSQKRELADFNVQARTRNIALDALHYVWCDGGCKGGVHRWGEHAPITAALVAAAIRNTNRLLKWFVARSAKEEREAGQQVQELNTIWARALQSVQTAYAARLDDELAESRALLQRWQEWYRHSESQQRVAAQVAAAYGEWPMLSNVPIAETEEYLLRNV